MKSWIILLLCLLAPISFAGWSRQTSNTSLQLMDVCFVDSLCGWAVGGFNSSNPADTSRGICLRTTDGGNSWATVYDTSGRSMMMVVSFVNPNHGWMIGDSSFSLATTDGGVTWSVLPDPGYYFVAFALRFVDDTLGFLLGGSYFYGMMDGSSFGRSTDGGNTWTEAVPYRAGKWLFGLDSYGPGWVWSGGGYDTLYRTTNAGGSWQGYAFPAQFRWYNGIAFGDTSHGVAVSLDGYILRTSDGGRSWEQRPSPTTQGLYGAEMPDLQHAWACGGGGTIIASTDGGMNWETQVSGTSARLNKIWFVNDHQGWAVGDSGVILHTDDGGWSGVCQEPSCFTPSASRLTAFPNPFTSFATLPGHEAERFSLYDISGRKVGTYLGNRIGEGLSPGVYFLRSSDTKDKPLRIVKVR